MEITIKIDCNDVEDIFTHLSIIRQQLRAKFKKIDLDVDLFKTFKVEDNNCYGYHSVIVKDT